MHMDISQDVVKYTGKWPDTDDSTSNECRVFTVTVRSPSVAESGHTVWGEFLLVPPFSPSRPSFLSPRPSSGRFIGPKMIPTYPTLEGPVWGGSEEV